MNKALIAVLMLCIIGGSAAFTMNAEKCFTQAAAFSHQVKGIIAAVSVSPISISKLLGASYDTFETVNPLIQGCGFDLPLLDQYASYKPANASKCFTDLEQLTNIALELKAASDASKDLSKNIFEILPKVLEAFKIYNQAKIDCEIVSKEQTPLLSSNGFDANIFKCISEAQTTLTDAKKFIADSKADVLPMEDIFEEGINVYNEVVVLLRDCGAQKIALPTVNNVAELKNCAKDIKNTVSSIEKTLVALKERKFTELFTDAKNVYAAIISDVAECPKKNLLSSSDIFACIADGVSISKDLKKFVESAKSKNTKDIVIGAYTVLGQLGPLAKDCDLNLNIDIPKFNPADLENCAANTDGLVNTIQQLASDVSGKKLWNIVSDVTSAVSQLKSIVNFCKNTHAMLSVSADPLSCISHAKKLYEEVNVLIENSKTNNVPEIVFGAYTIVESLQPLVNECGLKFDLHIPTITFPDLKGCVVDTQSLINNFKTIRDDYNEKNYLKIFDDAAEVVKTLQNVAVICKPNQALQTGIDILTCINDAKSLYSNVDKLVADSKNKAPVNEIVVLAYNTVQSLQPLIDACGLKVDLHIPAITFPDLNGCVIDASGLVETVKAIKDDVKSKKIENIFDHVAAAVIALQDIATKCKPQKALLSFNILKCFQSGQKVYSDVKNFVDLNKDSKPLNEVVVAAFNIIKELQPFVNDCDLKIDLHIPDIDFNDLNGCVADSSSIVNDFKTLAQQLKDKDYISIIGTIQSAISAIKSVADECKVHKNAKFVLQANILTCAKESQLMLKRASALIAEYKSKQVADVVVTAYDMVENLQTLVDACVPKQVNLHIPKITFVNLKQCVVDVQTVISIVNTIKNDVKVKNWNKIITDSKSVVASFQQIKSHCSASKKVLEAVDPSKIIACLSTSKKVYEDVKTFVDINKDKRPINEIVVHAFGLIEEIQPLFNTCGIKADLHIPQIDFNDLNGCVVDGQKIVDTVKSLLADLKAKNFINLVSDVQTVIQASKNVATECKTQKKPALEASLNIHCISNLGKVAKDAFSVYQKLKNTSDIVDELLTIQGFLTDLQPACDSCGIKVNIPTIPSEGKVIATVECVADVTKAVESIGALYANATSLNVIGAYSDIKTIISSVTDANQKCRQIKQTAI